MRTIVNNLIFKLIKKRMNERETIGKIITKTRETILINIFIPDCIVIIIYVNKL